MGWVSIFNLSGDNNIEFLFTNVAVVISISSSYQFF